MSLYKIRDFYPDYRDYFDDKDILKFDLYSNDDKVGSVDDLLVDDNGKFRYLIINTGAWIFGKKVLLPIGRAEIDYSDRRVYVHGLTRDQVENLPEYDESAMVDYDYEERVRGVYRPMAVSSNTTTLDADTASLDTATSLDTTAGLSDRGTYQQANTTAYDRTPDRYDRETYEYDREPNLFNLNERNHQNLKLYEERLIANKTRQKTGEVTIGKRVDTETQRVSVPVEREHVVIERVNPTNSETAVTANANAFQEGEVMRMDVYEETPDVHKETFVREEVRVTKEVEQNTVEAEDTIRKERLDINKEGDLNVRGSEQLR